MRIPPDLDGILVSTPDTLHGAVRFAGTRVFAHQLFDYLLNGKTLDTFLKDFEGISREQTEAVKNWQLPRIHEELNQAALGL